jgi:hypothetical protein
MSCHYKLIANTSPFANMYEDCILEKTLLTGISTADSSMPYIPSEFGWWEYLHNLMLG